MRRFVAARLFLVVVLSGLILAGISIASRSQATARAELSPNIIVVMTDDQRGGTTLRHMPYLRGLVAGGTSFEQYYATQPLCCPSRASYMTGLYPHHHGITDNTPTWEEIANVEARSLAPRLQQAGYTTAHIGKYLNGYACDPGCTSPPYVPPGWDEWYGRVGPKTYYYEERIFDGSSVRVLPGYSTDAYGALAVDFIRRQAPVGVSPVDHPFFLEVMPIAPHDGAVNLGGKLRCGAIPADRHFGQFADAPVPGRFARSKSFRDKPRRLRRIERRAACHWRRGLESLLAVDDMVANIDAALRRSGLSEETVLIFTSDNGYDYGEHGVFGKDLPYDASAHVPLIVRGPGFHSPKSTKLVANIDLPVTIADLAGASLSGVDGRSLFASPRRRLLLEGGASKGGRVPVWRAVVTAHGRELIQWRKRRPRVEFYDLRKDPRQLHPIHGHRRQKQRLVRAVHSLAQR